MIMLFLSIMLIIPRLPIQLIIFYHMLISLININSLLHSKTVEPILFKEAMKSDEWVKVMKEENVAMEENNTWTIVPLPKGKNVISCKLVYKIKYKVDGSIKRYKARLVAKRFGQHEGIEFF